MPKFPRPTGKQILMFLLKQGFLVVRVRGSHHVIKRGTLRTVIPIHGNEPLKIGTLRGILKDVKMTPELFLERWERF